MSFMDGKRERRLNDGKFKIAIIDKDGTEIELNEQYEFREGDRLALVKMSNGEPIPEEEPVHVFRARDEYALPALYFYRQFSIKQGCNDYHDEGVRKQIERFENWKTENFEKMKIPGITRGL